MAQIQLTSEEQELLRSILETELSELHMEIADTDQRDYRKMLKDRRETLKQLLEKLQPVQAVTGHA